ncbi:MAG: retropepsin-like domain-containing protein [Spirochaetaceae bacterium]|nr:retropepsin-like domain-containing protein [Spirochaetaceae bacterium]
MRRTITYQYAEVPRKLITPVYLYPAVSPAGTQSIVTNALWDTGATFSAISVDVANQLKLVPADRVCVTGVHSTNTVDAGIITVELPDHVIKKDIRVAICTLNPSIGMILGMDIIMLGDLAVSNGNGQSLFSFAIPPFKNKMDFSARKYEP